MLVGVDDSRHEPQPVFNAKHSVTVYLENS
jgi:hypothetical protein